MKTNYGFPDFDFLSIVLPDLPNSTGYRLIELSVILAIIVFIVFKLSKYLLNILFTYKDSQLLSKLEDDVFLSGRDTLNVNENVMKYITEHYGPKAVDNLEFFVDKSKDLHDKLLSNLNYLKQLLHLNEIEMSDRETIHLAINATGSLLYRVEKDFSVFLKIFEFLSKEDESFRSDYNLINDYHIKCLNIERQSSNICIVLLSNTNND